MSATLHSVGGIRRGADERAASSTSNTTTRSRRPGGDGCRPRRLLLPPSPHAHPWHACFSMPSFALNPSCPHGSPWLPAASRHTRRAGGQVRGAGGRLALLEPKSTQCRERDHTVERGRRVVVEHWHRRWRQAAIPLQALSLRLQVAEEEGVAGLLGWRGCGACDASNEPSSPAMNDPPTMSGGAATAGGAIVGDCGTGMSRGGPGGRPPSVDGEGGGDLFVGETLLGRGRRRRLRQLRRPRRRAHRLRQLELEDRLDRRRGHLALNRR